MIERGAFATQGDLKRLREATNRSRFNPGSSMVTIPKVTAQRGRFPVEPR
jgi:hypothetical protein